MYNFFYAIFWWFQKIFMPVKIIGKENLLSGKAILSCNHQTNLDFLPIYLNANSKLYALCKEEIFKHKIIRPLLKIAGAIPVNRQKPEMSSIKKCLSALNEGSNLLVFPSGTRSDTEDLSNLKNGIAMFSLKTKAPIVPMVYLKKNRLFRRNTLVVGKPIYVDELEYNKENMAKLIEILETKMKELKNYKKEA